MMPGQSSRGAKKVALALTWTSLQDRPLVLTGGPRALEVFPKHQGEEADLSVSVFRTTEAQVRLMQWDYAIHEQQYLGT